MNKFFKITLFTSLSLGLIAIISCVKSLFPTTPELKVGEYSIENTYYNILGTSPVAAPATLSTAYASSTKTINFNSLKSLHLDVAFTPTTTNEYALIKIEQSNDECVTFFPLSTKSVGTTEIGLNVADATSGVPVIFPSTKISTAATVYYGSIDFDVFGDCVKISAKSVSTTGAIYIRASGSSK